LPTLAQWRLLTLELERDLQLGAVGFDLALGVQLQIELDDLGDAEIAQGFSGPVDGRRRRLFPGVLLVPTNSIIL
jgi:hypothetical protein